jgi:endonuclease G, mitochondrial
MAKEISMESLKAFVRKEGSRFLEQPNVTSIGIGFKIVDGKTTDRLSVQFTVGRKIALQSLQALGAEELPKSFLIDGVEVPTDVLQRSYGKAAREVRIEAKIEEAAARKAVIDPVVPGVSVGNKTITAGTAGCVVYDSGTGKPYILSNWHVLHGPKGAIGDVIVQPGPHDDNRVDRNGIGVLVRSHLGVAGDCAIASVDKRGLEPVILDLGVAVNRIGEAELGDKVVKSGRTTDVTYGLVTRVHTTVKIDYGEGETSDVREIGCFEIGPDSGQPAANGQISMGGDSGSAWLLAEGKKATDMMLGLHFAGEVGDEPEHALACYAASVFEKLGVSPAKPAAAALEASVKQGYQANFVGTSIPFPAAAAKEVEDDLVDLKGGSVVDYTHFSLAMSRSRRFARWVAWNVDGGSIKKISRTGLAFRKDPKLPQDAQVGNELYSNNKLDKGHIARRADLTWGTDAEAGRANEDSFYYTNITPQHERFNQSAAKGIWGELENAIFEDVDVADLRVSVMGGPILSAQDPEYRGVKLPRQFWKIIYFRESGKAAVRAKGYVLTQADLLNRLEVLELPDFAVYEVPVAKIGDMTGLKFFEGQVSEEALRETAVKRKAETAEAAGPGIRLVASYEDIV